MLKYRYLTRLELQLAAPIDLRSEPEDSRQAFNVVGGTFSGGRMNGSVFESGTDWLRLTASDAAEVDLETAAQLDCDGPVITMRAKGRLRIAPETIRFLADRHRAPIDQDNYYLRITPYFSSADPRAVWLNHIVAFGIGELGYASVAYDIFEVL